MPQSDASAQVDDDGPDVGLDKQTSSSGLDVLPPEFFRDVLRPWLHPYIVRSSCTTVPAFQRFCGVYPRPKDASEEDKHAVIDQAWKDPNQGLLFRCFSALCYVLAQFGALLGSHMYYILFLPFLFWSIDTMLARHVVWLWAYMMFVGQAIKDHLRLPRPPAVDPTVRCLEGVWALEFGFPSTHVLAVMSQAFMIVVFTYEQDYAGKNQYPLGIAVAIAFAFTAITCMARLYLGVHCVPDLIGGFIIFVPLFMAFLSVDQALDAWATTSRGALILPSAVGGCMLAMYPRADGPWVKSAYGDTAIVSGVAAGVTTASHLVALSYDRFPLLWLEVPFWSWLALVLARSVLGFAVVAVVRAVVKPLCHTIIPRLAGQSSQPSHERYAVDIPTKFIVYSAVGFTAVAVVPAVFEAVGLTLALIEN
eukprot:m.78978 g.78978  ORF g.78978 m.78978 type:complete len:421 (+) comp14607_c0_seq1:148-1410(+)